ncbi:MAG: prefoldin subunit alpha [Nitrososphaerales archaeon]
MSGEERIQQLVSQMKVYEAYLNDILARENTVVRLMEEGRLAIEAIRNISGQEPMQTLMPVGLGIYMHTSVSADNKLLINIGAGVAIEKRKDDVVTFVESRLKEMEVALRSMTAQKQELAAKMEQTRAEVNTILQKIQKSG